MFKVAPSDAVVEQVDRALDATSDHDRVLRDTCLPALADALRRRVPDAAIVRVPRDPDRVERALLDLASQVGPDCLSEVAGTLRHEPGPLDNTLRSLEARWGARFLVVDGLDALRVSGDDEYDAGYAQADRYAAAHAWFAKHARLTTSDLGPRDNHVAAPAVLQNGRSYPRPDLWQQFAPDDGAYNAALAWLALRDDPEGSISLPAWKLRARVVDALPDEARECLWLLGLHGRPLATELLVQLDSNDGRRLLGDLGLATQSTSGWTVDRSWAQWCDSEAGGDERAEGYRRRLVGVFTAQAHADDVDADRAALSILEAHRHCVALGDEARALTLARYGWSVLIEEGKRRSRRGRYHDAARLYSNILLHAKQVPLPAKLRGYVRHYAHYNRAKANLEKVQETERGYQEAVAEWPENALFWSRLVRTQVYAGRSGAALTTLADAEKRVPDHPEKEAVLIGRTVRGLLQPRHDRRFLVEAAYVWGEHRPRGHRPSADAAYLKRALDQGWTTSNLSLPDGERLVLLRPQRVRVVPSADFWVAELIELQTPARGPNPRDALIALVTKVRQEARDLIVALSHTLSAERRLRKQILLGAIDVIASGLDAVGPRRVWVAGELARVDGAVWLRTSGSREVWFSLTPELAAQVVPSDQPYLAEVEAGPSGQPRGPVTRLEPVRANPEELWEAWRLRMISDA